MEYLPSLRRNGILTKSEEKEYDVIVCATGFDTSFRPAFPIISQNGVSLAEKWSTEIPKAYFSTATVDFPN